MKYINKKHKEVIDEMFSTCEELVYNSTKLESKFLDFVQIRNQLIEFNSDMAKYVDEGTFSEAENCNAVPPTDETAVKFQELIVELYESIAKQKQDAEV